MEYTISTLDARSVAGFHLVGPWEKTTAQGFEQLAMWVEMQGIEADEWIAVYSGNPQVDAPESLGVNTVVTVPKTFSLPENSPGVIKTEIAGGRYAIARVRVEDNDFARPWMAFFTAVQGKEPFDFPARCCFEIYLNDCRHDDIWDIEMHIPLA